MKFLKQILDFYIHSSLHVALAIASLVGVTTFSLKIEQFENNVFLVLFGTLIGYNLLKYLQPILRGRFKIEKHKTLVFITMFSICAAAYLFFQLPFSAQILLIIIFLLVSLYPLIRKLGWLKIFWVAFCVTEITVHFPLVTHQMEISSFILLAFKRFFIVIALLIPFEIYDSKLDAPTLQTLPQRFGVSVAKKIGYVMIGLFLLFDFLNHSLGFINFSIALISALAIYFSSITRNHYYTSFWVESIPILWLFFYIILSNTTIY